MCTSRFQPHKSGLVCHWYDTASRMSEIIRHNNFNVFLIAMRIDALAYEVNYNYN